MIDDTEGETGLTLGDLVSHPDPKSDPYMKEDPQEADSDDEDVELKQTDNLMLVAHVEGNAAILEVYGSPE